jgi:hypothetical protein
MRSALIIYGLHVATLSLVVAGVWWARWLCLLDLICTLTWVGALLCAYFGYVPMPPPLLPEDTAIRAVDHHAALRKAA